MEFGIALGSNSGDRLRYLKRAVELLSPFLENDAALEKSPVFATEPVDCPDGSDRFLNAVVIVQFPGDAEELLSITQRIEIAEGRAQLESRVLNGPRTLDLDLLFAGDSIVATDTLVLPHPRLHLRRFVLEPLSYLRPVLILPGQDCSVKQLLDHLQTEEPPLTLVAEEW